MPGRNQRKKPNWLVVVLCSVLVAVNVFLAVLVVDSLAGWGKEPTPTEFAEQIQPVQTEPTEQIQPVQTEPTEQIQPTQTEPTEQTQPTQTEPTEQPTEAPTEPAQPAQLTQLLESNAITWEELEKKGCSQLITVVSDGTAAQISFFICRDGIWEEQPELSCRGRVGRKGVSANKREGDGCTPVGLYGVGSAFYIHNLPQTKLETFQITDKTYWVDDPNSAYYNQKVEGTQNKDWNSAEHMISYTSYRYGFVVEYNLQAEKNAGSAIFFHIGDSATSGCIATQESMVLAYLKALDKAKNPQILIVSGDDA